MASVEQPQHLEPNSWLVLRLHILQNYLVCNHTGHKGGGMKGNLTLPN